MKTPDQLRKFLAKRPWFIWVVTIGGILAAGAGIPVGDFTALLYAL